MHYIIALLLLSLPAVDYKTDEKLPLSQAQADAVVDSVGRDYYRAKFELYPAYATAKGVHEYDSDLSLFTPRQVNAFFRRVGRLNQALEAFHDDSLSMRAWIDMQALSADMATQVFTLQDLDMWHRSPLLYSNTCIDGVHDLLIRPVTPDLSQALEARLSKIPDVVAQARLNLTDPIGLHCEVASINLKDFAVFLDGLRGPPDQGSPRASPEALDGAVEALRGFAAYLDSIGPDADPVFALGRDNLVTLLRTQHLIEEPLEDLLSYAESVLEEVQALKAEKVGAALTRPDDRMQGAEPDPGTLTQQDILDHFHAETESARAFIRRRDLVTLPVEEEIRIVETPSFLRSLIAGYAYMPAAPLDETQTGFFFIPLPGPMDEATRTRYAQNMLERRYGGVVVHEAFPGHHLQLTTANRLPSYITRLQENMFAIEGWAFYCEEMMAEEGYYGDSGIERVLGGIGFRAARVIVDIKLQTGEFSLAEATDFVVIKTGAPREFVTTEVRRYAVEPTQAMSYLIGKREILRLREEVRSTMGDSFTLKAFHDCVLSCGSLPPRLLKTCVISKVMGRM